MNNPTELLSEAIALAADKHRHQHRKDGTPYIYHPLKIAEMVKDAGYGVEYQVVAILHDILEDTNTTEADLQKFGEDVLLAVKLLTRLPSISEDEYVSAILQNHIASIVKNADKMHNVWEASYCQDKEWAKKYVKKAQKYYHGRFTYALDRAIGNAKAILCVRNPTKSALLPTPDDMMLYSDRARITYINCKKLYEQCIIWPDFTNPDMQYWYNELGDYYFCFVDHSAVWSLGRSGWLPLLENPIQKSEYGDELRHISKEEIHAFIREKIKENYFYDFIDIFRLQ